MRNITLLDKFKGCLLGGALGDALGYPVENMSSDEIIASYGRNGITVPKVDKQEGVSLISDNTQMSLFTAEGMIWADRLGAKNEISSYTSYVFYAYQRWLYTQKKMIASREYMHVLDESSEFASFLLKEKRLYTQRTPDAVSIDALMQAAEHNYGKLTHSINNSKECGGVVRVAPAGLYFYRDSERAFRMAAEFAAITHTNPTGYLAAGTLGAMIAELVCGADIEEAIDVAVYILKSYDGCMEVYRGLDHAQNLYAGTTPPLEAVKRMGLGMAAEEALAIAVYCVLCHSYHAVNAMCLAVNHSGSSSVIGSICGSMIGASLGAPSLPRKWLKKLECTECVEAVAERLCACWGKA